MSSFITQERRNKAPEVSDMEAILFTAKNCPKCEIAKKKIAEVGAQVVCIDGTSANGYVERAWRELVHIQTAPVLYIDRGNGPEVYTDIYAVIEKIRELGQ